MPEPNELDQVYVDLREKLRSHAWSTPSFTEPKMGWVCPVCRAVYAPFVASCLRCPDPDPCSSR